MAEEQFESFSKPLQILLNLIHSWVWTI